MKVRNILFLVLASLLLCTAVSAAEYTDVSDTHWAYKQIDYLSAEITGYPDGSYKPEKSVSRAEFLTLFARIAFPDEWKRVEGEEWWKSAYEVCTAHDLLNNITGSRSEAMLRGEIAALLERFCSGWGGVHERADAAEQYAVSGCCGVLEQRAHQCQSGASDRLSGWKLQARQGRAPGGGCGHPCPS